MNQKHEQYRECEIKEQYTKQQQKTMESRKKLLEAAEVLFSEKPIDKVGLREICTRAGVTTGTFYYHFEGKADILSQLYERKDRHFKTILDKLTECPPYRDKIRDFFQTTMAVLVEKDGIDFTMYRMFQLKIHSTDTNELYIGLTKLIELAQQNGELRQDYPSREINKYLFLVFRGTVYEWCIAEGAFDLQDEVGEVISCALRSFWI